jgi:hypothetical protein
LSISPYVVAPGVAAAPVMFTAEFQGGRCSGVWIGTPIDLDLSVLDPPGFNQGIARFGKTDF